MAEVFPTSLKHRTTPNLRLGIKSSCGDLKSIIAALYIIFKSTKTPENIVYSKEKILENGIRGIELTEELASTISATFPNIVNVVDKVNYTPLFTRQCEPLQVAIELFFNLGRLKFTDNGHSERTGKNRYSKTLMFSDKMIVIDAYLSAFNPIERDAFLSLWLEEKHDHKSSIEDGFKQILSTFTIDCCYKIKRGEGNELIFNLENIYEELANNNDVLFKENGQETVGPTRVLCSYIKEHMSYDIACHNEKFITKEGRDEYLKIHYGLISNTLDLINRELPFNDFTKGNNIKICIDKEFIKGKFNPFITALRTKPFMLLAGISGTGKSRIVRKLAQATVTEELQRTEEYKGTDFANDRWKLHSPANFELIQVKPNWHNSMDVTGYLSNIPSPHYIFTPFIEFIVKAWQHPEVPFFLCLDEMNLAPVEEYFAEFLSAIESRSFEDGKYITDPIIKPFNMFGKMKNEKGEMVDVGGLMVNTLFPNFQASDTDSETAQIIKHFRTKGLTLPKNLIVIGTVNMDETTFSFSRKVLDRAMSVEMNEVDYDSFLTGNTDDELKAVVKGFEDGRYGEDVTLNSLLVDRHIEAKEIVDDLGEDAQFVIGYLKRINALLEGTPFKLGYRAANEALIYLQSSKEFGQGDRIAALDNFTLMKILSRIEGDETKLKITNSETDKERIANAEVNIDDAKQYGDLNILTAMRNIITQQLGECYDAEAKEGKTEITPTENDGESNEENRRGEKLQSVKKIDNMLSQLRRDHFVSYWN